MTYRGWLTNLMITMKIKEDKMMEDAARWI